jgi:hypothetical protein
MMKGILCMQMAFKFQTIPCFSWSVTSRFLRNTEIAFVHIDLGM